MGMAPVKWLLDRFVGIDARRAMPPFAAQDFEAWFRKRKSQAPATAQKVVLFHDCFMTYNYPEVGRAAVELLERAGFEILLVEKQCCGRQMISKGLIEDARSVAQHNIGVLEPYVSQGIPVLGCEPSCLLTLRDEYLDLVDSDAARKVASNAWMVDEFLVQQQKAGKLNLPFKGDARKVLFHGHCHQKAHIGSGPSLEALRLAPGMSVSEVNSGCCGMAGSFGFEKEHYDISETIGRQRLMPAVEQASAETEIAVTGVSCRQQISHFTQRKPRHVVEVLRDALVD
jgi:Fe-S oxidoreductase